MKILILGINFHPEPTSTGKYTTELAVSLADQGYQVHVVTAPPYYPQWQIQPGYSGWNYQNETWHGMRIFRCPLWVPKKPSGIKRLWHLLSFALSSLPALIGQIFWKPALVLCIAPSLFSAPSALLAARLSGAKAWLHIQDFELDLATNLNMLPVGSIPIKIAGWAERRLMIGFDRISTISNRMLVRLVQKGLPPEKTLLFPNWVDTEVIFPLPAADRSIKKQLHIPENKVIVLYSGSMGVRQGLENVVQSARQLCTHTQLHFVLCGDGVARPQLEKDAADLKNIQFLPTQPLEMLNPLLNIADIHILPQRAKAADFSLPSKLSGMLASGKAVIVTANPGTELAEVMDGIGVVVQPGDVEAFSEAILKLAENPEQRRLLAKAGRDWVVTNWSKENVLAAFCRKVEYLTSRPEAGG
jgi:colanic acid biosynthesis glycosyl transferase WcaI